MNGDANDDDDDDDNDNDNGASSNGFDADFILVVAVPDNRVVPNRASCVELSSSPNNDDSIADVDDADADAEVTDDDDDDCAPSAANSEVVDVGVDDINGLESLGRLATPAVIGIAAVAVAGSVDDDDGLESAGV